MTDRLAELLGADLATLLYDLGEQLFPADVGEPTVLESGAFTYVAGRLEADPAMLAAYRDGLRLAADERGSDHSDAALRAWLESHLRGADDLPTGLSGSLSPEAIEARKGDARMFAVIFWQHLREGMFGDPRHGGNTGGVMWRWLGYNGPQLHGYTESELLENALPLRPMRFAADWQGVRE